MSEENISNAAIAENLNTENVCTSSSDALEKTISNGNHTENHESIITDQPHVNEVSPPTAAEAGGEPAVESLNRETTEDILDNSKVSELHPIDASCLQTTAEIVTSQAAAVCESIAFVIGCDDTSDDTSVSETTHNTESLQDAFSKYRKQKQVRNNLLFDVVKLM